MRIAHRPHHQAAEYVKEKLGGEHAAEHATETPAKAAETK